MLVVADMRRHLGRGVGQVSLPGKRRYIKPDFWDVRPSSGKLLINSYQLFIDKLEKYIVEAVPFWPYSK